ncbi:MAG TPA: S41 family peptidase [Caldilineaceae bacterium]|nr:S41 family peptidase [Caldilineaceae bacterium]
MQVLKKQMAHRVALLLIVAVAFGSGTLFGGVVQARAAEDAPSGFEIFWQAWGIIQDHFVDRAILDSKTLTYGAIEGLVRALGDEGHTTFLTAEELERQRSDMAGSFFGIGAQLGVRDGLPIIVAPFDGSPAAKAGIKAGDIILGVDGEDVTTSSLDDIVERVRGPEGTEVTLTVLHEDATASEEITVVRGEIKVAAVSWTMLPESKVAFLRLSQFSANAQSEIVDALQEIEAAGAEGVIVDVRNNPGGLLAQAVGVTSQFLERGNVLQEESATGRRRAFRVQRGGVAQDIPMVVLINPGSASSAEIFAGAVQDHERGQLIGETTFGTGTVLQSFELDDGSALLLGTSQWLTADGRLIRKQGIAPDIEVTLGPDGELLTPDTVRDMTATELTESGDTQLLTAIETLTGLPLRDQTAEQQPEAQ